MKRSRVSYQASFKLKVVKAAEETNNLEAARKFSVDESNVRRWRKDTLLESEPKAKRARRGPKTGQFPEMEEEIKQWVDEKRQNGYGVSRLAIRLYTLRLAKSGKYEGTIDFKASQGRSTRFLARHGLALRQRTKIAQKLPKDYEKKIVDFQQYIIKRRKEVDYPLCRIGNMDETPMCFDMPSTRTVNKKGEKTVMIKTTGHEKTHFTVVLTCMADGGKLPPMVIFKRKTPPKDKFPSGVVIHQHPKGWMDEPGVIKWLSSVWERRNGGLLKKPSLLVWDQFKAHLTDKVKGKLKDNKTVQAVIPGGLTGTLQPLDVSLNKPFKAAMREQWATWMGEGKGELTVKGNMKRPPLPTVVSWVKTAWDRIPADMVQRSFLKCCISNNLDGSEDDALWQEEENEESDVESDVEDDWDADDAKYTQEEWDNLFGASDDETFFEGF